MGKEIANMMTTEQAKEFGKTWCEMGNSSAAYLDKDFYNLIDQYDQDKRIELGKAWLRGWSLAALEREF